MRSFNLTRRSEGATECMGLMNGHGQLIDSPLRWRPIVHLIPSLRMILETGRPSWCSSVGRQGTRAKSCDRSINA